jgi:hypothetical protein
MTLEPHFLEGSEEGDTPARRTRDETIDLSDEFDENVLVLSRDSSRGWATEQRLWALMFGPE